MSGELPGAPHAFGRGETPPALPGRCSCHIAHGSYLGRASRRWSRPAAAAGPTEPSLESRCRGLTRRNTRGAGVGAKWGTTARGRGLCCARALWKVRKTTRAVSAREKQVTHGEHGERRGGGEGEHGALRGRRKSGYSHICMKVSMQRLYSEKWKWMFVCISFVWWEYRALGRVEVCSIHETVKDI